jgi:mannosyltransferase OCH1-like enzyme
MSGGFPKIIHQIYNFWDNKTPSKIRERMDNWKNTHPDFKYILWNKKKSRDFIKKKYNWFLPIWDRYPYTIQCADAIRYFILYEYGGIYSDIDLDPVKPIDGLLQKYSDKNILLYKSPNSGLITNDFMVSKKGMSFWKKSWYELIKNHNVDYYSKHITVMYSTGPLLLDYVYEQHKNRKNGAYCVPTSIINNCDIASIKPCYNKGAYLRRYDGNSWHSIDSSILNIMYKNKFLISIIICIILAFTIYNLYKHKIPTESTTIQDILPVYQQLEVDSIPKPTLI